MTAGPGGGGGAAPRWAVADGCGLVGLSTAAAPTFSGLALLTVLLTGALVGAALFLAPYPRPGGVPRPAWRVLRWWLLWAVVVTVLETAVILAGDDLRWPTFSAMQDPLTTAAPLGRFAAGAGWAAAGLGLIALTGRYRGLGPTTRLGRTTAAVVVLGLIGLAVRSVGDGAMLRSRTAPSAQAVGIDTTAVGDWPLTAWVTIAVFVAAAVTALLIHRYGRGADPPGAIPDLLAWLMAPWVGRVLGHGVWLWCGWHFLSR